MESTGSEHARGAVFAADGSARHRLVRVVIAAGVALLAAWVIALALGVLGGFDALPGLPSANPDKSASSDTKATRGTHVRGAGSSRPATRTETPSGSAEPSPNTAQSSPVRVAKPQRAPSATATISPTTNGRRLGTTKPTGKPVGSPGNADGGSGAPGQLR
jgi:cytoskeletal protein RodZ